MTEVVGLIGFPIRHSISPAFQQPAFDAEGLDVRYEVWELPGEELSVAIERLNQPKCLGANVTIPHKAAIIPYLDAVDATARAIGAVNTIVHRDEKLIGSNTDLIGFAEALRRDAEFEPRGKRVLVCGAGGSARAVVAALAIGGAIKIDICARRIEQATNLIVDFHGALIANGPTTLTAHQLDQSSTLKSLVEEVELVVNTTPVGMLHRPEADRSVLPIDWLYPGLVVFDLVYNPPETPMLRAARERGARTLNGLPMLVYQGAASFERWTGRRAPVELMRRKALEALGG